MFLDEKVAQAHAIMDAAIAEHTPVKVISLFSGGDDSLVTTHVASLHPRFSGVAHINTGTSVREGDKSLPEEYVRKVCKDMGWPLSVYRTPEDYETLVMRWGFPGPAGHRLMYQRLKDRCIYMLLKDHKTHRLQRIGLVSGIRQQESQRRMGYDATHQRYRAQVWMNPLFYWSEEDLRGYRLLNRLPQSPVKATLGMSGECLCGAFAKKGELARIRQHFPETADWLEGLQARALEAGWTWGWEDDPPRGAKTARRDLENAMDFQPLCTSCNFRAGQVTPVAAD